VFPMLGELPQLDITTGSFLSLCFDQCSFLWETFVLESSFILSKVGVTVVRSTVRTRKKTLASLFFPVAYHAKQAHKHSNHAKAGVSQVHSQAAFWSRQSRSEKEGHNLQRLSHFVDRLQKVCYNGPHLIPIRVIVLYATTGRLSASTFHLTFACDQPSVSRLGPAIPDTLFFSLLPSQPGY